MIRIIRLIGSVLIVLVGFVLGILVNNARTCGYVYWK